MHVRLCPAEGGMETWSVEARMNIANAHARVHEEQDAAKVKFHLATSGAKQQTSAETYGDGFRWVSLR